VYLLVREIEFLSIGKIPEIFASPHSNPEIIFYESVGPTEIATLDTEHRSQVCAL